MCTFKQELFKRKLISLLTLQYYNQNILHKQCRIFIGKTTGVASNQDKFILPQHLMSLSVFMSPSVQDQFQVLYSYMLLVFACLVFFVLVYIFVFVNSGERLKSKLYDKHVDLDFPLVHFPFLSSNMHSSPIRGSTFPSRSASLEYGSNTLTSQREDNRVS